MGWWELAGRLEPKILWKPVSPGRRRYQVIVRHGDKLFTQFAPSGSSEHHFRKCIMRINGGTGRGGKLDFPSGSLLRGAFLANTDLRGITTEFTDMRCANLEAALLCRAGLSGSNLSGAFLIRTNLFGAHLIKATLDGADVTESNMYMVDLRVTSFAGAAGLTQKQLQETASGYKDLKLPAGLQAPSHWRQSGAF